MNSHSNGAFRFVGRPRFLFAVSLPVGLMLASCNTARNPNNAPAIGTIGGVLAGAAIGSISGNAGNGAVIGGLLGQGGGEIVRNDRAPRRTVEEDLLVRQIPNTLKEAERFDSAIVREYNTLAQRRASNPAETLVVKAQAKQRLREIDGWISNLQASENAADKAARRGVTYGATNVGSLVQSRNRLLARIASLKQHRIWFKNLAS